MDIKALVEKYKSENPFLWNKIGQVCESKDGKWDLGLDGNTQELTQMLIYEYSTSLERITNGKLSAQAVVEKLSRNMGTFRFGDFKAGQDDHITYGEHSVTSEGYKKQCRINSHFGAHQVDYKEDGKHFFSVVMFDGNQKYTTSDGIEHTLSGGNLDNLNDIRQTLFHEWTHVMEKCYVKTSELTRDDVIKQRGDSTYINACISADYEMQEYKDFIANVDNMLENQDEILFNGISTIEINERKSPDRRIMHNLISEGATELISKAVMESLGIPLADDDRYKDQVDFATKVFDSMGRDKAISTYLTSSNKIISYIDSKSRPGEDLLRDSDTFINTLGNFERMAKDFIRNAGNHPGREFDRLRDSVVAFWREKREPSQDDVEKIFEDFSTVAKIPEREENQVKWFIRFAMNYPSEKSAFDKKINDAFPPLAKTDFSQSVVNLVEKDERVTDSGIQNAVSYIGKEVNPKDDKNQDIQSLDDN